MAETNRTARLRNSVRYNPELWTGAFVLIVVVLVALVLPLLRSVDPYAVSSSSRYASPGSPGHLLGADGRGRDILARLAIGIRASLLVAVVSVALSGTIGSVLGIMSGYFRGAFDAVVMRIIDVLFAFPVMLLALLMITVLGSGTWTVMLAISIVFVPYFVRIARASTLGQMSETYTTMLRSSGAGSARIMFRHVLPNIASPLTVQAAIAMTWAITVEASLSYLGLGQQPPNPSLGGMISEGQSVLTLSPWVAIVPALTLVVIIFALNLLGDGLRDLLDPRGRRS